MYGQVQKMGGEIRVVKKNGPGTLMQLYLLLRTPVDIPQENYKLKYADHNLKVSKVFLLMHTTYIETLIVASMQFTNKYPTTFFQ